MLFWKHQQNLRNRDFQAASSLFSKAATSPEHDSAQKQMPGSKFNPTPGFTRIDPSAVFSFLTF